MTESILAHFRAGDVKILEHVRVERITIECRDSEIEDLEAFLVPVGFKVAAEEDCFSPSGTPATDRTIVRFERPLSAASI